MRITSKQNAIMQKIIALQSKKGRRAYKQYLLEGKKQVREALNYNIQILQIIVSDCFAEKESYLYLLQNYKDIQIIEVPETLFAHISTNKSPQGILAVLPIPETTIKSPQSNAILLDEIQDCGNIGTILRSANAFGIQDIYLKNCADPFSPKTVQASMSSIFFVRLHIGGFSEMLDALENTIMIGADLAGKNLQNYHFPEKCCLVLGNEGNGISQEVQQYCFEYVTIPIHKQAESLNVAVAASILMFSMQK